MINWIQHISQMGGDAEGQLWNFPLLFAPSPFSPLANNNCSPSLWPFNQLALHNVPEQQFSFEVVGWWVLSKVKLFHLIFFKLYLDIFLLLRYFQAYCFGKMFTPTLIGRWLSFLKRWLAPRNNVNVTSLVQMQLLQLALLSVLCQSNRSRFSVAGDFENVFVLFCLSLTWIHLEYIEPMGCCLVAKVPSYEEVGTRCSLGHPCN